MGTSQPELSPGALALLAGRDSLANYAVAQIPSYQLARHNRVMIEHLEALERGEFNNLCMFVPPQNGKSTIGTQLFPAWFEGRHPEKNTMMSAYSQELIEDFSQKVRNLIGSPYHQAIFPECELDDRWNAKHDFRTTVGGGIRAMGRGGAATGRPADLYVLDDVIKNREEANSPALRRELRTWFTDVVLTRRQPDTKIIIINTRWDPEDLCGWLLGEERKIKFKVLDLPALGTWQADGTRIADEQGGDALWPERFPRDFLEEMRDIMTRDSWLSLYQQRPNREGDETVFADEWFQFFTPRSDRGDLRLMNGLIVGDPASKKKKGSDSTVMWVVGMAADRNYYFVDGVCDKYGLSERWDNLKKLHQKWNPIFKNLRVFWESIGGNSDIEYFKQRMNGGTIVANAAGESGPDAPYRFHVEPVGTTALSKSDRIRSFGTGVCKDMRVFWNETIWGTTNGRKVNLVKDLFEQEWINYPAVAHDDRLDAASYILDKKVGESFPRAATNNNLAAMYAAREKRRKGAGWMGQ